jgi:hypothetical protein
MRRALLIALLASACGNTPQDGTPSAPDGATPEGGRPAPVILEARVEGLGPTFSALRAQVLSVGELPSVEEDLPEELAAVIGVTDPSVFALERPAGLLVLDLASNIFTPVAYLGISSEGAFRKALPAEAQGGDPRGNALVYTPPDSARLSGEKLYLNFLAGAVVASTEPRAFAVARPYLETVIARPAAPPAIWAVLETGQLWKKYGAFSSSSLSASMPATPGIASKKLRKDMLDLFSEIDRIELRHTPGGDRLALTTLITPKHGSALEARLKRPSTPPTELAKKLPVGWMSGVTSSSPETFAEFHSWSGLVMPGFGTVLSRAAALAPTFTGEIGFSLVGAFPAGLYVIGIKDPVAAQKVLREAFAAPSTITLADTPTLSLSAVEPDAENLGGVKVDRLVMKYDLSTASEEVAELFSELEEITFYYAYLPGMVVGAPEAAKDALEQLITGEAGSLSATPEVSAALAALSKDSLGNTFLSIPLALKLLADLPVDDAIKSGMALGWGVEGGRLRLEMAATVPHLQDLKTLFQRFLGD